MINSKGVRPLYLRVISRGVVNETPPVSSVHVTPPQMGGGLAPVCVEEEPCFRVQLDSSGGAESRPDEGPAVLTLVVNHFYWVCVGGEVH